MASVLLSWKYDQRLNILGIGITWPIAIGWFIHMYGCKESTRDTLVLTAMSYQIKVVPPGSNWLCIWLHLSLVLDYFKHVRR